MRYFEIKQDKNLMNTIEFEGFAGCPNIVLDRKEAGRFRRSSNMYIKATKKSQYPDMIQSPVLMVSHKLYRILKDYDVSVIYKNVVLTCMDLQRQDIYRLVIPKVLQRPLVPREGQRIFYVKEGMDYHLIVSENVLEHILATGMVGLTFQPFDLKGEGR